MHHLITLRFYEELNDFLPLDVRKRSFMHRISGSPSVKDVIESVGVPHCEVDLILVDGTSVSFEHPIRGGERITVYPQFESFDIQSVTKVRPKPLRVTRFICDIHLGKCARWLRLLGFDTHYDPTLDDPGIVDVALKQKRIILTRDRGLLKRKAVTHGYCLRSTQYLEQVREILRRFDLCDCVAPFTRCTRCNGKLICVEKAELAHAVPAKAWSHHHSFQKCQNCRHIYWRGTHYREICKRLNSMLSSITS